VTPPKKKSGKKTPAKMQNRAQKKPGTGKKPVKPVKVPEKRRGAPSKYDPDLHPYMAWDLSIQGKTNKEIAAALRISTGTLFAWGKEHPEFLSILKSGKDLADAKVTNSLFQLAFGYEYEEVKTEEDGVNPIKTTRTLKHVPGNPTACFFWLCNRRKNEWRNVSKVEVGGTRDKPIAVKILRGVSMEDL
jgi:hypothetical protein